MKFAVVFNDLYMRLRDIDIDALVNQKSVCRLHIGHRPKAHSGD